MEFITKSDLIFVQAALASLLLLFARRLLRHLQQLHVVKKTTQSHLVPAKPSKVKQLPPTRSINKALTRAHKDCVVFYGSQTGTAEQFAHQFAKEALQAYNLRCLVADLEQYDYDDFKLLPANKPVVFVVATFGEGEPTDNAVAFHDFLKSKLTSSPRLEQLQYGVFGLGSTAYRHYNAVAKYIDRVLNAQGANRLGPLGLGNDGAGTLEDDFMTWKDAALSQIASCLGLEQVERTYEPSYTVEELAQIPDEQVFLGEPNKIQLKRKIRGPFTAQNPFPAPLTESRDLFSANSQRKCMHLEFDISSSTLDYETGDHLAVWPMSAEAEVKRFLRVFGLPDKKTHCVQVTSKDTTLPAPLPGVTTYEAAARYYLDICGPVSRSFLSTLAAFVDDASIAAQLVKLSEDKELYHEYIKSKCLNVAQVLEVLRPGKVWDAVPFSVIIEGVGRVKPRFYSISSSSLASKKVVSVTAVVESRTPEGSPFRFEGLATSYLQALHVSRPANQQAKRVQFEGETSTEKLALAVQTHHITGSRGTFDQPGALIHVRKSKFRLPKDHSVPVIMIGPGTGVAPFRAFVQERSIMSKRGKSIGKTILFYGCRRADEDFLYCDEWKELEASFPPSAFSMHVAFSRQDPARKVYVQHLLHEQATVICDLVVNQQAQVYVCGDAAHMAKDVFETVTSIVAQDTRYAGDSVKAKDFLFDLKSQGRWLEDVW